MSKKKNPPFLDNPYAVLVDLTDSVAKALNQPFAAISIEMVFAVFILSQAHQRGQADDIVTYLVAHTKLLGIVKRKRKAAHPSPLELIPILTDAKLP